MRSLLILTAAVITLAFSLSSAPAKSDKVLPTPVAPKSGIRTPGVQISAGLLKPEAEISVDSPGWITTGESIFIPNRPKDMVVRVDPKGNNTLAPIAGLKQPCSGTIVAFGSLWIPNCSSQSLSRVDTKTGKTAATLEIGAADVSVGIAATADSVWMLTDSRTTLSRIDPATNQVVAELRLPANCNSLTFGEKSLWVTCPSETRILRIDPETNLVTKRIQVSAGARSVAFGAGSVWVLCEKEGKIERIDPKTGKVIKTLETMVPNAAGNLAFSENYLWVTQTGFPLTRIDVTAEMEKIAQQFWGDGGGSLSSANGALWLSNTTRGTVWRLDPKRVLATLAE